MCVGTRRFAAAAQQCTVGCAGCVCVYCVVFALDPLTFQDKKARHKTTADTCTSLHFTPQTREREKNTERPAQTLSAPLQQPLYRRARLGTFTAEIGDKNCNVALAGAATDAGPAPPCLPKPKAMLASL